MASPDDSDTAALTAVLAELYAVAPDEFVATRTRLAKEAKTRGQAALGKEVGRLRRPTVSAWAVNQVVREHAEQVAALRNVGRKLRAAQGQLDAAAMRDLRPERDRLLEEWAAAATEVTAATGRPLAPAALDEVRGTVIAALAGEDATDAVASGHLTRALSYSGFGEVDLSEAVVRTSSGAVLSVLPSSTGAKETQDKPAETPAEKATAKSAAKREAPAKAAPRHTEKKQGDEQAAAEREQRVDAAREAHAAAQEAAHEARLALDQARDRADETRWRVEDLEEQLKAARQEHRDAEQAATAAARARRAADVDVAKAERAVRDAGARR